MVGFGGGGAAPNPTSNAKSMFGDKIGKAQEKRNAVIKELAAMLGVAAALGGAVKIGEATSHIHKVKVSFGKPSSELEVDFVSDEHGHCHAGSHTGLWQPHVWCEDRTY